MIGVGRNGKVQLTLQDAGFHVFEYIEPENIISQHDSLFYQFGLYLLRETR